jgi:hypothetical protein
MLLVWNKGSGESGRTAERVTGEDRCNVRETEADKLSKDIWCSYVRFRQGLVSQPQKGAAGLYSKYTDYRGGDQQ